jgi:LuxR family maltose regulon positive regulatory protein
MQKTDALIRTKLRLPFTRSGLVPRPRLQAWFAEGLRGPLTLITAPAGFGKTTLIASCVAGLSMPVAWLSLDKDDNQAERFLRYVVTALHEADHTIGNEAVQLLTATGQAPPEVLLTSLINDLDATNGEIALVLDDYQFINSQVVHAQVAFLLEHCPQSFHLVIATRSDPPLPLARLRARGQMVELRTAELRFTELEATQFLNNVMGLGLDAGSVATLAERTEGWIAGLQMASIALQSLALQSPLSVRDYHNASGFIAGFSGTNRYILDYLLEEVLAVQSSEVQRFLMYTSILERLTAPLCDAVLANDEGCESQSVSILDYLERANLFLFCLGDERVWFRYHHLFADLLRAQLQRTIDAEGVAQLHVRAADWYRQNGSILEAINHASLASDDERVERFIEQNYMELVRHGEQSCLRFWIGKLSKERIYNRPWLCIYEAYSHSWFGELDEADLFIKEAEKRMPSDPSTPDVRAMQGLLAYVKSRVAAMRGDLRRAIELCLAARECISDNHLALQLDTRITLGYVYFLSGDYANAIPVLQEMIQSGMATGAVINTVAGSCLLARLYAVQGLLNKSYETYRIAAQSIPAASGEHRGAKALVEVGIADVLCEWNDLDAALDHIKQGLLQLLWWDKADDWVLAYITLARIHLAQANHNDATEAVEKAIRFVQTKAVFSEARTAVEAAQVKLCLARGDLPATNRSTVSRNEHLHLNDPFGFESELTRIAQGRVLLAQNKPKEALGLLLRLEEIARSSRRMGRVVEILLLEALTLQRIGDAERALLTLTACLTLAEPESYVRIFLDEGQPMQMLLAHWLAHAGDSPLRDYTFRLLSYFDAELHEIVLPPGKASPADGLIEPLTQREFEILHLIALGNTNKVIAQQLFVAPGTVKAHTASIYRKLDVANRTEAVARARQLGLLP